MHAAAAVPYPDALPAEQACLIGCCIATGIGSVLETARLAPGARVAVIGCGAVGLSVVQGARLAEAGRIIAVDVLEHKLEWAREFGATDLVHAGEQDPVAAVRELTDRVGADYVYDVVGHGETLSKPSGCSATAASRRSSASRAAGSP